MGPIILFDKSFLQSLSLDEAVLFDHFFLPNICPIFFVETLADLDKALRAGRTPEQEVGMIAAKTPEMNGSPNAFHGNICIGDLLGHKIPMTGQILLAGGRAVRHEDKSGTIFEESPEVQAFKRWQEGKFTEVEHSFARIWREMLKLADFDKLAQALRGLGLRPGRCKRLEDAKTIADAMTTSRNNAIDRIRFTFWILGIPQVVQNRILLRWTLEGKPALSEFAPYASFVLSVQIFFQVARATELVSKKPSAMMDISYLFYLPFCMVFASSDRLHERCAPLFLRRDQGFVPGIQLKDDLDRLEKHFDTLPEAEKERGLYAFADKPPLEGDFLISRLWDRYLPNWRKAGKPLKPDSERDRRLVEYLKALEKAPDLRPSEIDFDHQNGNFVMLKKKLAKRRGKWWQLPKDLPDKE